MMADVYNARIKVPVLLEEATPWAPRSPAAWAWGCSRALRSSTGCSSSTARWSPDPEAVAAYGPVKEAFEVCYKAMLPVYEYMASHKNA
mgnify:CR=1 FL=1